MLSSRLLIGQRIALGFLVPLFSLLLVGGLSMRNLEVMQSEAGWVTHTIEILSELGTFSSAFSRIESSGRGYLISGEASLQVVQKDETAAAFASAGRIRNLTADNSSQQVRIERLIGLLNERVGLSRLLLEGQDASNGRVHQSELVRSEGKNSEAVEEVLVAMRAEETRLLALRSAASQSASNVTRNTVLFGSTVALFAIAASGLLLNRSITRPLSALRASATKIGQGDYAHRVAIEREDEVGHLGSVFNTMAEQVQKRQDVLADQDWLKTALAKFSAQFQWQRDPKTVGQMVLGELAGLIGAHQSAIYQLGIQGPSAGLELCASYASFDLPPLIQKNEGLLGQSFMERRRILVEDAPPNYLRIGSSLGSAVPSWVLIEPLLFEGQAIGVMELASLRPFTALQQTLIGQLAPELGVVFKTLETMRRTEELLHQSQTLSAELADQRQVLATKNTELVAQSEMLLKSEMRLQEQQAELQQSNEELEQTNEELEQSNEEMEEKSNLLAEQKGELEQQNLAIERARKEVQEQARQLAVTSKYKSDFLATMSHELRTPLNSLLILARILVENREENLLPKQVQYAQTIASSGVDLLEMINQILDLAKIESGTVELTVEDFPLTDLQQTLETQFHQVAAQKNLTLHVGLQPDLPATMHTDARRLKQILKNLLSNSFKFTEHGGVTVNVKRAIPGINWPRHLVLKADAQMLAFEVSDTGIGIAPDKQLLVFESFQQADAGTARRFGGTGLGLSISRELAGLLGGAIQLESELGKGSTFTLFLPVKLEAGAEAVPEPVRPPSGRTKEPFAAPRENNAPVPPAEGVLDDRDSLVPGERVLLIIEDDDAFARILVEFAREKKFKALVARSAHSGISLAQRFLPTAITLDLRLEDDGGWMVLDRLKHDSVTRHIPVHVISAEAARERGLRLGAVSFLQKPVTREAIDEVLQQTVDFIERPVKSLLVVEDNAVQRQSICDLIGNGDVKTTAVGTAEAALSALEKQRYDCVVVDLNLPDQPGATLIREINRRLGRHAPPVIIYTGQELTPADETELRSLSETIIVKDARSPERLLDETALFLHRVQSRLPESKRQILDQVRKQDAVLTGRQVLVVDDDVRNIFALTAALETYGMVVRFAESGAAALKLLPDDAGCDVVLMDIMMPGMDGYETIRRIRENRQHARLPIIAVTAKAMRGDRERCIEAGASDYITKPVHMEKLLSLLRVWLYR